jgi:predicted DNA-binding protein
MSNPDSGTTKGSVKTLAIRLEPELHAQLSLIAQLRDSTITDEIRQAIEAHIVSVKATPELAAKAGGVLEDIEREAVARRTAIATLFGDNPASETEASPTPTSRPRGGRKPGGDA